jgi:hypothetical protein
MTLAQLKSTASDTFSFIIGYCPNFPPSTKTNTSREFEELTGMLDAILEKTRSNVARQWLRICLQEVHESWKHYENQDRKKGIDLLQRAEEHFKDAFANRSPAARFVAGDSGPAYDGQTGFPE